MPELASAATLLGGAWRDVANDKHRRAAMRAGIGAGAVLTTAAALLV